MWSRNTEALKNWKLRVVGSDDVSKNPQVEKEMANVVAQFLKQPHLRLLGSESWTFPLQLADVHMRTVIRSQMDVLMKMILKILKKLDVKQPSEISELLAVETIFVEHMLELLKQNEMVERIDGTYQLTASGSTQLEKGTFAHDPLEESVDIAFSPFHNDALNREQPLCDEEGNVPGFRFEQEMNVTDVSELDDSQLRQMIVDSGYEFIVEQGHKQIDEITSVELKETARALCYEFHVYDKTEDLLFIRVWNTWTGRFDTEFETQLNQKEASRLRKLYEV